MVFQIGGLWLHATQYLWDMAVAVSHWIPLVYMRFPATVMNLDTTINQSETACILKANTVTRNIKE